MGFVLICYGAADAIGSIICGSIVKIVGRIPIFIFGASLNLGLIIALFLWKPDPSHAWVFFVIAAFWGLADSIWQTQINCKPLTLNEMQVFFYYYNLFCSFLWRHLFWFRRSRIQQLSTLGEFGLRNCFRLQLCIVCQCKTLGTCRSTRGRNDWLFND